MVWMALIEIDGLPNLKMVDLSMANCECHNQMVRCSTVPGFVGDSCEEKIINCNVKGVHGTYYTYYILYYILLHIMITIVIVICL